MKKVIKWFFIILGSVVLLSLLTFGLNALRDNIGDTELDVPDTAVSEIPTISGVWKFDTSKDLTLDMGFVEQEVFYKTSYLNEDEGIGKSISVSDEGWIILFFDIDPELSGSVLDNAPLWNFDGWFYDIADGFIDFGKTPQAVSVEFLAFMKANAKQFGAEKTFYIDNFSFLFYEGMTWSDFMTHNGVGNLNTDVTGSVYEIKIANVTDDYPVGTLLAAPSGTGDFSYTVRLTDYDGVPGLDVKASDKIIADMVYIMY